MYKTFPLNWKQLSTSTSWDSTLVYKSMSWTGLNVTIKGMTNKKSQKAEMLDLWLHHTPNATWDDVIRALEPMGENRVAENILQIRREGKLYM